MYFFVIEDFVVTLTLAVVFQTHFDKLRKCKNPSLSALDCLPFMMSEAIFSAVPTIFYFGLRIFDNNMI